MRESSSGLLADPNQKMPSVKPPWSCRVSCDAMHVAQFKTTKFHSFKCLNRTPRATYATGFGLHLVGTNFNSNFI